MEQERRYKVTKIDKEKKLLNSSIIWNVVGTAISALGLIGCKYGFEWPYMEPVFWGLLGVNGGYLLDNLALKLGIKTEDNGELVESNNKEINTELLPLFYNTSKGIIEKLLNNNNN